ncbi:MAG: ribosome assembly cofactor RimP [Bacteroidales bacterium]|nr:ribosome assembly cofactor RimP [Bacteroidales bacterium]
MIEKIKILELVNEALEGTDKFLVNLKVTPDNRIYVDIDGDSGVTIDDCIALSRAVEGGLDRDEEDFALEVSSAGADQPLKMRRQYVKNLGREVEALAMDGVKTVGTLAEAGDDGFTLRIAGTKKQPPREERLQYADMKSVKVVVTF